MCTETERQASRSERKLRLAIFSQAEAPDLEGKGDILLFDDGARQRDGARSDDGVGGVHRLPTPYGLHGYGVRANANACSLPAAVGL